MAKTVFLLRLTNRKRRFEHVNRRCVHVLACFHTKSTFHFQVPSYSHAFTRYENTNCPNANDLDESLPPKTPQSLFSPRSPRKCQSVTVMQCITTAARAPC